MELGELSRQVKKVQSCLGKNMKIGGVVRDIQATPVEGVEILSESKGTFWDIQIQMDDI